MASSSRRSLSTVVILASVAVAAGSGGCATGADGTLECAPDDLTCGQPAEGHDAGSNGGRTASPGNSSNSPTTNSKPSPLPDGGYSSQQPGQDAGDAGKKSDSGTGTPSGSAADSGTTSGGVGSLCSTNDDCSTHLCIDVPGKGKGCSKFCLSKKDCPAVAPHCFLLLCLP